ncbi:SMP-30/gluconolactonase/LRE family protein [Duganella sp. FT80W]|uniref:SMP-30/gluconolactonase/LRE family protein n=1 Tax=Duganella guangzhouensis TaxID=2666084 RepID=A0A6I2KYC2_9BURK|nr:SMP-30/gluconolactonase/LRE family protein [Duganella guangzhouensis]MRW90500.1 SMP-30/gluconolactonase/LRE family protein [Duganella guangzhouensis]
MNLYQPECIWPLGATLAEGPVWHPEDKALYFVDIKQRAIHRCAEDGGRRQSWTVPDEVGFALPMHGGDFVVGLPGRLERFSFETGALTPLHTLEAQLPGNRLNDGYIDRHGALWFGSMDNAEVSPSGALYRQTGEEAPLHKDGGYIITNGPCVSPDGRTFYHTDTLEKTIYAFDLDEQGGLSNKRVFVKIEGSGYPDGTAVDADGALWVGLFAGGRIERYAASGQLLDTVNMPCSNITKVTFGGEDLRTVFVTTARKGLSEEELSREPLAGGIFSFRVASPGQLQHLYLPE